LKITKNFFRFQKNELILEKNLRIHSQFNRKNAG
jgi:hypothetical protein